VTVVTAEDSILLFTGIGYDIHQWKKVISRW